MKTILTYKNNIVKIFLDSLWLIVFFALPNISLLAQLSSPLPPPQVDFNKFYWPPAGTQGILWSQDNLSGEDWLYDVNNMVDQSQKPLGYICAGYTELAINPLEEHGYIDGCNNIHFCSDLVPYNPVTTSPNPSSSTFYFNRLETIAGVNPFNQADNGTWCATLPRPKMTLVDLNGNILWYKLFGSFGTDMQGQGVFYKTMQLANGNIIAVGRIDAEICSDFISGSNFIGYNPTTTTAAQAAIFPATQTAKQMLQDDPPLDPTGTSQGYIVEVDINGNLLWQYQYGNSDEPNPLETIFYDVVPLTNSTDLLVFGKTQTSSSVLLCDGTSRPYLQPFIMRINSLGQIVNKAVLDNITNTYVNTNGTPVPATYTQIGGTIRSAADIPAKGSRAEVIAVSGYLQNPRPNPTLNLGNDQGVAVVFAIDPMTLNQVADSRAYTVADAPVGTVTTCSGLFIPDDNALNIKYNGYSGNDNIIAAIITGDYCGTCAENFTGTGVLGVHSIDADWLVGSSGNANQIFNCGTVDGFDLGAGLAVQSDGTYGVVSSQLPSYRASDPFYSDQCSLPFCPTAQIADAPTSCSIQVNAYTKQNTGQAVWGNQAYVAKFSATGTLLWQQNIESATPLQTQASLGYDFSDKGGAITVTESGGVIQTPAVVTSAGAGYLVPPTLIVLDPNPSAAGAILTCGITSGSGAISSVTVINGGSGYTDPQIMIVPNFGSVGDPTQEGDLKRQSCWYKIIATPDHGFAIAGNNSNNLDDDALIKIQPDCQSSINALLNWGDNPENIINDTYYHSPTSPVNVVWNISKIVDAQVTIGKGATLYIEGPNTTIQFTDTRQVGHPSNITVLPGGKLVIADGATVTGLDLGCGSGDNQWEGIYVEGNYAGLLNHVQTPARSGIVQVWGGATVSNARNGIMSDGVLSYDAYWNPTFSVATGGSLTGGIIQGDDANFINNNTAIYMAPFYSYQQNPEFQYVANKSYLNNCNFSTDNTMATFRQFSSFVTLHTVNGVKISACRFNNQQTNIANAVNLGIGINAIDASFSVTNPCPSLNGNCIGNALPAYFTGLDYGIRAQNIISSQTFTCNNMEFNANVFGIKCEGVDNPVITQNTFYIGNSQPVNEFQTVNGNQAPNSVPSNVGVAMENSTGYTIEENNFLKYTYPAGNGYYSIGTWMNNTQVADNDVNQIYKNTFLGLSQAHVANNVNRGSLNPIYDGLSYFCNTHANTTYYDIGVGDLFVTADGVRKSQGSATLSAGNIFDAANGDDGLNGNFGNYPYNGINYYYDNGSSKYPNNVTSDVNRILILTSNTCPSNISSGTLPVRVHLESSVHAGLINNYNNSRSLAANATGQIATLTDGGNTAGMLYAIQSVKTASDASILYTTLIGTSPYLSATCLQALVQITDDSIMPKSLAYQVLALNPEQLLNDTVWQSIQAMSVHPFDSTMILGLDSSKLTISALGLNQATIINNNDSAGFAVRALLNDAQQHLYDTTGTNAVFIDTTEGLVVAPVYNYDSTSLLALPDSTGLMDTSYINLLLLKASPSGAYEAAFDYLGEGDYTDAQTVFAGIATAYTLDSAQTVAYHDLDTLLGIIHNNQTDSLNAGAINSLQTIAAKTSIASSRAQNLLRNYYSQVYEDYPIISNRGGDRALSAAPKKTSPPVAQNNVKVYPNPAGNYVTFAFKTANDDDALNLYIYSATGIQMYQSKLDAIIGQQVVIVNNWINGIYGYTILGTNDKIGSGTFVVSH